ncbi:MAG: hypothetical protein JWP97_3674 [Labilithrix sp.]|nr:hypothetical protein [Labilithrix sp.]
MRPQRWLAAGALLVGASTAACSLLFDTDDQCSTTQDCVGRGAAFAATQCVSNVCVSAVAPVDASTIDAHDAAPEAEAAPPDPFACGLLPPPDPDYTHPVTADIRYIDFSSGMPATQVDVRLCASTDALCTNARTTIHATDAGGDAGGSGIDGGADGGVGWIAPASDGRIIGTVERGFEGFFELRSSVYAPTLRFTSPPLREDVTLFDQILLRPAEIAFLADIATGRKNSYDATTRGLVFTLVRDCNQQPLSNVRFETTSTDPDQFAFYIVNTAPSVEEKKTDATGRGGYANIPPGLHTFTAFFADTGKRIGSTRALVRVGTNTTVSILPSP